MIYVIATAHVRPEHRSDFLENVRPIIAATHREEACQSYDLHSSITEPNCFVFVERWASPEGLEKHFGTPHMEDWKRLAAVCVEKIVVEVIHPAKVDVL